MHLCKRLLTVGIVLMLTMLLVTGAYAAVVPDTGFEIEGNLVFDGDGSFDWMNADSALLIVDPHSKSMYEPTQFRPDGKFDYSEDWIIQDGSVGPAQNELTNIFAWSILPGDVGNTDTWMVMGMERTKDQGTFALDFEFNQNGWASPADTLVRTPGDIVVGFELKGNPSDPQEDLDVLIVEYYGLGVAAPALCDLTEYSPKGRDPGQIFVGTEPCPAYGNNGWYYRFLANAALLAPNLGYATMNPAGFVQAPFDGYLSYNANGAQDDYVGEFEFAEAAINLTAFGMAPGCPGFGSVHAKTRSSLEVGSDLKDLAGPASFPINCYIEGYKYLDVNGNGTRDAGEPGLNGWTINLSNGETAVTADNPDTGEPGYYRFDDLADGDYTVAEDCSNQPAGWVQSEPFGNPACGDGVHNVTINLGNRVAVGNFGNGQPSIEIAKSCPTDVFVGDDIAYTITVSNTGNVDLNNVTVSDPDLNLNTNIGSLAAGAFVTLDPAPTLQDATAGTVHNTASVSGVFGTESVYATVTSSDDCTTNVHELTVTKDANTSFTRTYFWTIDKVVDNPGPISLPRGATTTVTYSVTIDLDYGATNGLGYIDSDWAVAGTITVSNPAPIPAPLVGVSDTLSDGTVAAVDCGGATSVPAESSITCTYGASLGSGANLTNTATATISNNDGLTTDFSSDAVLVDFGAAQITYIDEVVTITDTMLVSDTNPAGTLGDVSADSVPITFNYSVTLTAPYTCGSVVVENWATFVTNDTGTTGTDPADVTIQVACDGCTPGFWQGGQLETNGSSGLQRWDVPNDPDWGGEGTNPFIHTTLFNDYFNVVTDARLDGLTMLDLVGTGGTDDDARKAARSMVAAYLNESAFSGGYPAASIEALADSWYAAVQGGDAALHALHIELDDWNNPEAPGTCPL